MQHLTEGSFRSASPISRDDLRSICPAVFADRPHQDRSEKYAFIPTTTVLDALEAEGYQVFSAQTAGTRKPGKSGFQKHMLRLRHVDDAAPSFERAAPEIVLINSHDASSSYQLKAGLFRLVCSNGMVLGDTYGEVRTRHTGDIVSEVIEGSYQVIGEARAGAQKAEAWRETVATHDAALELATAALRLRGAPIKGEDPQDHMLGYDPERLLRPRRADDRKADFWTTMNVIQEATIRGGAQGFIQGSRGWSYRRLRPIKNIPDQVKVNRGIWNAAERIADGKPALEAA